MTQTISLKTEKKIPDDFRVLVNQMGVHVVDWVGNCEGAVRLFLRHFPIKGAIRARGSYTKAHTYPGEEFERPFSQHSWIGLPDGRVLDPTRWVFEGEAPYIYVGDSDYYDYGAVAVNQTFQMIPDQPFNKPGGKEELDDYEADLLRSYGLFCIGNKVHNDDLWWLSRKPPQQQHKALYQFFVDRGREAMIPIDNYHLLMEPESLACEEPEDGIWYTAPRESIR